jgi:dihydrodipicolinate synthase/N-acetylneuraminate lyase
MSSIARKYFTAVVCPFDADGAIDEAGYRRLIRYYVQEPRFLPVGGLIVNPAAGEIHYLSRAEKRRLLEIAMEEAAGKMLVFAGNFGWSTADAVEVSKDIKAIGADGVFAIPPAGGSEVTCQWDADKYPEVWLDMLKAQDKAADLPIITHPAGSSIVPIYGKGTPARATEMMCKAVPNIVGWKMTYPYEGNKKITQLLRSFDRDIAVLQSGGYYFHEYLASGNFDGTVSGFWNVAMEPMLDHIDAWKRGDVDTATKIWKGGLSELQAYQKGDGRLHVRYKIGAYLRGLVDRPAMRPPMPQPRAEEIETMYRLMSKVGIPLVDKKDLKIAA